MLGKIKKWFSKSEDEEIIRLRLPENENAKFILQVDGIHIGMLQCKDGEWFFKYTDDFKNHVAEYNLITGFSDLEKVYQSEVLWPFFQIRIPGLKQPAIREIIEKEKIDQNNEVELLKRFGNKTISNPYELVLA